MSVRVRFAPSPTGEVHIGNIRVAIFNWLFARHNGGDFLLRIEDTDKERSTQQAVDVLFDVMSWLKLDYDEPPVYQSTRMDKHLAAADKLLEQGLAYREDKGDTGKGACTIFRMPNKRISFVDEVKGKLQKEAKDLKDFVIVRSNGTPTFHLANIVDDIDMNVTHIIRGDDHVENTFKHVAVYEAMGAQLPVYAHLPMVVNQHGKPYSKRDGECFVGEFRRNGFLAEALVNYLALLGWSPGDDREKMSGEELVSLFSLDRVKSSPGQMDIKKLTHLNGQYIAELPHDVFKTSAMNSLNDKDWANTVDEKYFGEVCKLMQSRTHLYTYTADWKYFFSDELEYEEKAVRKQLKKENIRKALEMLSSKLAEIDFSEKAIEQAIRSVEQVLGIREGKLNQVVRVAATGLSRGAGIYETMSLLGKEKCVVRLDYAAANLCE
ncbi:MAG: glutamate--tRNA ligase [Kiritimatiellae bacterium]|nr:glutamate--tRNA ligase [Kiritimatiellia bacterium]